MLTSIAIAVWVCTEPSTPTIVQRLELPQVPARAEKRAAKQVLRDYLTRKVARSARFLDHGVIAVATGFGVPHLYRLELQVGVLDHLTLGATAHWLSGQKAPKWSPKVALALYRGRVLEVGAFYTQVLYPPTRDDGDPMTVEFTRRAHYLLATMTFSAAWLSGGFDVGWGRGREPIALLTSDDLEKGIAYATRDRAAGGLHARFGTRRLGVTAQAWFPYPVVEIALDVRFGAFELRRRGGWLELSQ